MGKTSKEKQKNIMNKDHYNTMTVPVLMTLRNPAVRTWSVSALLTATFTAHAFSTGLFTRIFLPGLVDVKPLAIVPRRLQSRQIINLSDVCLAAVHICPPKGHTRTTNPRPCCFSGIRWSICSVIRCIANELSV